MTTSTGAEAPTTPRYFGGFSDLESLKTNFFERKYDYASRKYSEPKTPEDFPTDDQILHASYGGAAYEGSAFVLFERDGTLFEVNGGHCSCYGLEGQWSPEETTWAALALRPAFSGANDGDRYSLCRYEEDYGVDGLDQLRALVASHSS